MQKRGLFLNKKAQTEKMFETPIGIIIAGLGIIAFIFLYFGMADLFGGDIEEQSSFNSFKILTDQVKKLLNDPTNFASAEISYSITEDYILVGFDKVWRGDVLQASTCNDEGIEKPKECFNDKACLCLYENTRGSDFKKDKAEDKLSKAKCILFPEVATISGPADNYFNFNNCEGEKGNEVYDNSCPNQGYGKPTLSKPDVGYTEEFKNNNYEFLVIYGKCKDRWPGNKELYIEKYTDKQNKIHIFISEKTPLIDDRKEYVSKI